MKKLFLVLYLATMSFVTFANEYVKESVPMNFRDIQPENGSYTSTCGVTWNWHISYHTSTLDTFAGPYNRWVKL